MNETTANIMAVDAATQRCFTSKVAAVATGAAAADDDFVIGTTPVEDTTEQQCVQAFEPAMVSTGLSQLGRSASGCHQVYERLQITHTDLQDPQHIVHCRHLQQLLLSNNCLTTLQPLSQLKHLTHLDVSHNRLTKALDYQVLPNQALQQPNSGVANGRQHACSASTHSTPGPTAGSSNLRAADLSFNSIDEICDMSHHSNLCVLDLTGNNIQRLGRALEPLRKLRRLHLGSNMLTSCQGLQGLFSLQELSLVGNSISSLQPLSGLSGLQVLSAAHNHIATLDGAQGLVGLRQLDVAGNQLRRVEVLAACRSLTLLTSLNVAGNPLQAAQDARLHVVHLLTQLQQLDSVEVSVREKVDAGNMVGASTDGLVVIRRHFFPHGELPDGGGAVPPTAAGLKASQAEEERSCADPAAMFEAIDHWARTVPPALALRPASAATGLVGGRTSSLPAGMQPLPPPRESASGRQAQGSRRGSSSSSTSTSTSSSRPSSQGSIRSRQHSAKILAASPGGVPAVAARLAMGCCQEARWRQLQLLRACYCWVLTHVHLPRDCSVEAGADLVTWDVGRHLFGEDAQHRLLHEVLLPHYSGTLAECVSQLLVLLLRECQMEAMQLSGFWKAGGRGSVGPGEELASHNHSWVAAKVNGRWRLLDPVYALVMAQRDQPLPFFLPPEAFIHTHLPFEPCWQLLPVPIRTQDWWQRPELSLGFAAAGGQLLDNGQLKACSSLQVPRDAQVLPTLRIPIAAPANPQQQLCISLLDHNCNLLADWQHCMQHDMLAGQCAASSTARWRGISSTGTCTQQDGVQQGQQQAYIQPAGQSSVGQHLVYQQQLLGPAGQLEVQVGPDDVQLAVQELWVAFPGPGTFFVKIQQITEVPGGLLPCLRIEGLGQPLSLTLRQHQDVLHLKAVVLPAPSAFGNATVSADTDKTCKSEVACSAADVGCPSTALDFHHNSSSQEGPSNVNATCKSPLVAFMPRLQPASLLQANSDGGTGIPGGRGRLRVLLLSPQPGAILEADRVQQFAVVAPAAATVAVGSEQSGWTVLQPRQADECGTPAGCGSGLNPCAGVFEGNVMLPRVNTCFIAVQEQLAEQGHTWQGREAGSSAGSAPEGTCTSSSWVPVLGLHVWPPVQDLVQVPEPTIFGASDVASLSHGPAVSLLTALDVDSDGAASRRDMLLAFRRDRQLADHLKMPARIRAGDGTYDTFLSKFVLINRSGLGYINVQEVAAYLATLSGGSSRSSSAAGSGGASRVSTAASSVGKEYPPRSPATAAS